MIVGSPSGGIRRDGFLCPIQMPRGVPVASVTWDGGERAALLVAEILARGTPERGERLTRYRAGWVGEAEVPIESR